MGRTRAFLKREKIVGDQMNFSKFGKKKWLLNGNYLPFSREPLTGSKFLVRHYPLPFCGFLLIPKFIRPITSSGEKKGKWRVDEAEDEWP